MANPAPVSESAPALPSTRQSARNVGPPPSGPKLLSEAARAKLKASKNAGAGEGSGTPMKTMARANDRQRNAEKRRYEEVEDEDEEEDEEEEEEEEEEEGSANQDNDGGKAEEEEEDGRSKRKRPGRNVNYKENTNSEQLSESEQVEIPEDGENEHEQDGEEEEDDEHDDVDDPEGSSRKELRSRTKPEQKPSNKKYQPFNLRERKPPRNGTGTSVPKGKGKDKDQGKSRYKEPAKKMNKRRKRNGKNEEVFDEDMEKPSIEEITNPKIYIHYRSFELDLPDGTLSKEDRTFNRGDFIYIRPGGVIGQPLSSLNKTRSGSKSKPGAKSTRAKRASGRDEDKNGNGNENGKGKGKADGKEKLKIRSAEGDEDQDMDEDRPNGERQDSDAEDDESEESDPETSDEEDEESEGQDIWLAQIEKIRAKSKDQVWLTIRWCYASKDQLLEANCSNIPKVWAKNEVYVSDHRDVIHAQTVDDHADVYFFDDTKLFSVKPIVQGDFWYRSRLVVEADADGNRPKRPYLQSCTGDDLSSCPVCDDGYTPTKRQSNQQVFCPNSSCGQWMHIACLSEAHSLNERTVAELETSGLDTEGNVDLAFLEPDQVKATKFQEMLDQEAIMGGALEYVLDLARSSITRGGVHKLVGNAVDILAARAELYKRKQNDAEILPAEDAVELELSGKMCWTCPTCKKAC